MWRSVRKLALLSSTLLAGCTCHPGSDAGVDGGAPASGDGSTPWDAGDTPAASDAGTDADGGPQTSPGCGLATCASSHATCGPIGDGCGAVLQCGSCTAPQTCGGGGIPSQCGGTAGCVPRTCAAAGAECGALADGCGGLLNCGTCAGPSVCGGGGLEYRCGTPGTQLSDAGACVPRTCASVGANCGAVGDGCGGLIDGGCGTCASGQICGGGIDGGHPNLCGGAPACVPRTCAQAQATCGAVGDGCGGLIDGGCGTCSLPSICGGSGLPNVCGSRLPDAGSGCTTALCQHQQACPGVTGGTKLTGTVVAPTDPTAGYGQPDPIPGALVYVANGPLALLNGDGGVSCDQCTDGVSGNPLVSAYSNLNGTFTLNNVPCGIDVPVVIQLGKWRRVVTVPAPTCCTSNAMTLEQTRLPRKQAEGSPFDNIPRIAVVTGSADVIECVLPKLGIAADQYARGTGTGRVRLYRDNGEHFDGGDTNADVLYDNLSEMRKHDIIIIDCVGGEYRQTVQRRLNLEAYANAGGRVFASHYAYVWLFGRASDQNNHSISFTNTATWNVRQTDPMDQNGFIDTSFEKGSTFADWVHLIGAEADAGYGRIPLRAVRNDLSAVIAPAQRWVHGVSHPNSGSTSIPLQYTFNTPLDAGAANQCGRVLFSDFHVIDIGNTAGSSNWPGACSVGPMTPQEKVFEYLIFDLSSCIAPDVQPPPTCTPKSCNALDINCGLAGDGCGGVLNCGTCTAPATCGGGGVANVCGTASCTKVTCASLGVTCGLQGDGCGGALDCGSCPTGQTCGGAGVPGQCGRACVPMSCAAQGLACGPAGDGCGGLIDGGCGSCPTGQTCGGGGSAGQCGAPPCTPRTCASAGANCGALADGCGGTLDCGTCPSGLCGGSGIPNVCGGIQ